MDWEGGFLVSIFDFEIHSELMLSRQKAIYVYISCFLSSCNDHFLDYRLLDNVCNKIEGSM